MEMCTTQPYCLKQAKLDWYSTSISRWYQMTETSKAMLASYGRSVLAAVLAVVSTGNYMPEDLLKAALAAALPPIIRWLNPKDPAFGRYQDA
jgi:hypothetical protein